VFEDSLFATNARREPRRGWAAVLSFGMQAVLLGVLVLVPLLYTDALPISALRDFIVEIPALHGRPQPPTPPTQPRQRRHNDSNMENAILLQPRKVPDKIAIVDDRGVKPNDSAPYIPDGLSTGIANPALTEILASNMRAVPPPKPPSPTTSRPIRLSIGVTDGLLIHKVTPVYSKIAIATHTQGRVVLQALIGRDGSIENLHVISGHPLLISSALEAVKQWRYRPYLLNNEPVEVETQITVNFTLGGM
jgi:periplasmic protein TonB